MDVMELKDHIYLVVMNTMHTEVFFDHFKSPYCIHRSYFRSIPDKEILSAISEMVRDGHLEIENGEYISTKIGREIFASGGYISVQKKNV